MLEPWINGAYDTATLNVLQSAYDDACTALGLDQETPVARRELLAKLIMSMAATGDHDASAVAQNAVTMMRKNMP